MKISIVVPSFNQARYLGATLDSVFSQSHRDVELIVNDGGSTDGTVELLRGRSEEFRWSSGTDHGQADAINKGLREASGEILAYLNSDDVYLPDALAKVAGYFHDHPECQILYGDAYHLHADGSVMEEYYSEPWNYSHLLEICYICQPAVFWRRSLMEQQGVFDDRLHYALDYDYWLRVGAHLPLQYLRGHFLAGSRLHQDTKTLGQRVKMHREILQVVMAHSRSPGPVLRWLKHLASITATQSGLPSSPVAAEHVAHVRAYAAWILVYAEEFQIKLDSCFLRELDSLVDAAELELK
jgi:glycosyltransferase involved in cell wall biosynthesis